MPQRQMNEKALAAFEGRAAEPGPVVMLNLLRFRPDGGRERYAEYVAAGARLLRGFGASAVYMGESQTPLFGESAWDAVLLVEYPSRQAFLSWIASAEFKSIEHLRSEALLEGELHPMETATLSGESG